MYVRGFMLTRVPLKPYYYYPKKSQGKRRKDALKNVAMRAARGLRLSARELSEQSLQAGPKGAPKRLTEQKDLGDIKYY